MVNRILIILLTCCAIIVLALGVYVVFNIPNDDIINKTNGIVGIILFIIGLIAALQRGINLFK